jgi:dolichol-phosphate mannosyltransferase
MSAGTGLLSRVVLFPVLQGLGLHYLANILVGILTGAAVNYCLSHRFVFKDPMAEENP